MPRAKKIEEEIKEAETKVNEIASEIDTDETDREADTLNNIKIKVYEKEYSIVELINIVDKEKKTLEEVEITKKFKILMKNYYDGIVWAILRPCCGKKYSVEILKEKLKETNTYDIIDIRCSRKNIRFNKTTVDIVIHLAEKYKLID